MLDEDYDEVGALMRASGADVDTQRLQQPSAQLARDVARTVRRRRSPRRAVAISLAAIVVAVPTTAAGYAWTTHTGVFGDPNRSEEDGSEWLDMCAPDFYRTARSMAPTDVPLPAGATMRTAAKEMYGHPDASCDDVGARFQADGVRLSYESWAWCSWVHDYLRSDQAGEAFAMRTAARQLGSLAASGLLAAHDGGGTVAQDREIATAAAAGDTARVALEGRVNCSGFGYRP